VFCDSGKLFASDVLLRQEKKTVFQEVLASHGIGQNKIAYLNDLLLNNTDMSMDFFGKVLQEAGRKAKIFFCCVNDYCASSIVAFSEKTGRTFCKDTGILGFNGTAIEFDPRITTIAFIPYVTGQLAVGTLHNLILSPMKRTPQNIKIKPDYMFKETF